MLDSPSYTRIPVYPPSPTDASLPVKNPELIKPKLVLEPARSCNAGSSSTNYNNRVVSICIMIVTINAADSFPHLRNLGG